MTFKILFCCNISREMFNGKSSESTIPLTKERYSGMMSSQLSMMNTLLTYNFMLYAFFFPSNKSNGFEFQLTFHGEVLHRQLFFPIVRQRLVKRGVFVLRDLLRVSHPDRLLFVHDRPLVRDFFHRLLLLLLGFVFVFNLGDFPFLLF